MDLKHLLLVCLLLIAVALQSASAGKKARRTKSTTTAQRTLPRLLYGRALPDDLEKLKELGLNCQPGRTTIIVEAKQDNKEPDSDDGSIQGDRRRHHMRHTPSSDETCTKCVCSVNGMDEFCQKRPAANINECLYRAHVEKYQAGHHAFDHERDLSQMIRRDLIWNTPQDMPDPSGAICPRGATYYTNDENAMNPKVYNGLILPPDTWDRLDFCNMSICFFCVCSVSAYQVKCNPRPVWFCDYYRNLKDPNFIKEVYKRLFGQERAGYFRTLSTRMRRNMDDGINALLDVANTKAQGNAECVPFVSQYTDCSDENRCLGCKRCSCSGEGRWSCTNVQQCSGEQPSRPLADADLRDALSEIQDFVQHHPAKGEKHTRGQSKKQDSLIVEGTDDSKKSFLFRKKRAIAKLEGNNGSIVFHDAIDELNEDTLKNTSHIGTIEAKKVKPVKLPDTRRMGTYMEHNSNNLSALDTLHVEFNHPQAYARHVTDNKLDSTPGVEHHDALSHDKLHTLIKNKTQTIKDKDLSKLVVNELQKGQEHIGEKDAPVMSNITFTPENDTLTAIAFIAGNLLNKLWSIEKYEGDESIEVEVLKQQKIAELLDLFKEPMTMKQETFLKNALEKLSDAVDKNKEIENLSLCKNVEEAKKQFHSSNKNDTEAPDCDKHNDKPDLRTESVPNISPDVAEKVRHIMDLAEKFEHVQSNLDNLKLGKPLASSKSTEKPKNELTQYGKILQKLTKILLPSKRLSKERIAKKVKTQQLFSNKDDFVSKVYRLYDIDLGEISLTPKDRLLMDYLLNVEKSPDCLLGTKTRHAAPASKIEGEILFNLSEFFKVRSFVDLMKLIGPQKSTKETVKITTEAAATKLPNARKSSISYPSSLNRTVSLSSTKEKLKNHLKSIIEDLTELQNSKGGASRNYSITDLLPCLSNLLATDNTKNNQLGETASKKIQEMFINLENEQAVALPTRRTLDSFERPKSAVVWERIIQSFEKQPSRRLLQNPNILTLENLKQLMKLSLEKNNLILYENIEDYTNVQPSDKLVFLKSIRQDCSRLKDVLEAIDIFIDNTPTLKSYDAEELETYVQQVIHILHIAQNLFSVLKVSRPALKTVAKLSQRPQLTAIEKNKVQSLIGQNKLTREQILNQLIKNRVELYVRAKEASGVDLNGDISYDIALRALKSLKTGDYALARELYKTLVSHKLQKGNSGDAGKEVTVPSRFSVVESPAAKRPLPMARFEEPEQPSQDELLQQLLNINNLKFR